MLSSSDLPSAPRWLDLSYDIGFLSIAGFPAKLPPTFRTFVFTVDILSLLIVN
jgi:hypothetical protein